MNTGEANQDRINKMGTKNSRFHNHFIFRFIVTRPRGHYKSDISLSLFERVRTQWLQLRHADISTGQAELGRSGPVQEPPGGVPILIAPRRRDCCIANRRKDDQYRNYSSHGNSDTPRSSESLATIHTKIKNYEMQCLVTFECVSG